MYHILHRKRVVDVAVAVAVAVVVVDKLRHLCCWTLANFYVF